MSILTLFITFLLSLSAQSKPALVVAGDSWAYLPCFFNSVDNAINSRYMDVEVMDCLRTSKAGARAENFKNLEAYEESLDQLKKYPNIKAVYLSLGGNDMFNYWSKTMNTAEENQLFLKIKKNIEEVVNSFHAVRPDIYILVNGYDYGYLYDNNPIKTYREIYERMGKPSPEEVNSGFIRFSKTVSKIKSERTIYIQHNGLMHYYYGIPELGIEPYKTLSPANISTLENPMAIGGDLTARNAPEAMIRIFSLYVDPHHISPQGFEYLVGHSIDQYLSKWLTQ